MDEVLRRRLLALAEQDQVHANSVLQASERLESHRGKFLFDIPRDEWLPEYEAAEESAARLVEELKQILDEHGWPGRSMVGEDGCLSAWVIAQHAGSIDPDFQRRCERALTVAVENGEAKPGQLAALRDRVELEAGRPQLYGTHLEPDGDSWRPAKGVDDEAAVDRRRAELGLTPWREYLADCLAGKPEY